MFVNCKQSSCLVTLVIYKKLLFSVLSNWFGKYRNSYPPHGQWPALVIYLGIHPPPFPSRSGDSCVLFTSPSGDSCTIQCGQRYARCDWSLPINTSMTSRKNVTVFLFGVQHGAWFWKCLQDFPDYASKGHENSLAGAFYQKEKRRNREKESSWPLENV